MSTSAQQMRAWQGPALLSFGFRPFFLFGALWAALAMALWIALLNDALSLPSAFDPVSWHAHELLFGYLGCVAAGFLLTAVPNWTGRLPIVGWPLGGIFALWLGGSAAVALSAGLPPLFVAFLDLAMPVALAGVVAREILTGHNWRNLPVLGILGTLILANTIFHWEAAQGYHAATGFGLRLGLAAGVLMIALIGGRIVPSFTRNWLVRRDTGRLPTSPMQRFDLLALLVLLGTVLTWVVRPDATATGYALLAAGILHLIRLAHWAGHRTTAEPLVWVLHVGYAFLPLGALTLALEILSPGTLGMAAAQHLWMAGGIGLMTLAVMTRATLGHTGRALTADRGTVALYLALIASVLTRATASIWIEQANWLLSLSALAWIAAFGGFAALYGPLLARARHR